MDIKITLTQEQVAQIIRETKTLHRFRNILYHRAAKKTKSARAKFTE
jgi:hypothetical protein